MSAPPPLSCDHCPAEAVVVAPGTEPDRLPLLLLSRGEPQRRWCLACARQAGWPWLDPERRVA